MEDHVEKFRQADALAQNILRLTRNTLLVNRWRNTQWSTMCR